MIEKVLPLIKEVVVLFNDLQENVKRKRIKREAFIRR